MDDGRAKQRGSYSKANFVYIFFFFFLQQMHLQETKPASGCREAQRAGGGAGRGSE